MNMAKKHDWGLIVAGALLILCAFVFVAAPGITLATITLIAGAAFLVSGVFDIVGYVRFREAANLSGWTLAYAVLDIVIGLMFLIYPIAFAAVIPWVVGAFFVAFGIYEVVGSFRLKKMGVSLWGWPLFSGIVSALCGLMFFFAPPTFSLFLALFVMMRGVSLLIYGWNVGRALTL